MIVRGKERERESDSRRNRNDRKGSEEESEEKSAHESERRAYSCLFIVKNVYITNKSSNKIMENSSISAFCSIVFRHFYFSAVFLVSSIFFMFTLKFSD